MQHVGGGCNVIGPERVSQRGWRLWSPRRDRSNEGSNHSHKKSRRVVIEPVIFLPLGAAEGKGTPLATGTVVAGRILG